VLPDTFGGSNGELLVQSKKASYHIKELRLSITGELNEIDAISP
jgi:hypothetical protein